MLEMPSLNHLIFITNITVTLINLNDFSKILLMRYKLSIINYFLEH
jgi:hypothetical protein